MNKRLSRVMAILAAQSMLVIAGSAIAGSSDTETVTYAVSAINEINIDGTGVTLTVDSAVAGAAPTQATDSDTYDITTNVSTGTKKITASINSAMDSGLTLQINVTAPSTGTSAGAQTLSESAVDVVTAISAVSEADIAIGYTLDATAAAGVVSSAEKTVTLTIADS